MSSRQAERHGAAHVSRSGLASQRRRIVASKLAAPPRRPGIVDRPVLLDGLVSTTHAPIVLVSAPAGYGKTTLLALWGERDQRPCAWVSLDAADNDPVALLAGVLAALDRVLELDAAITDSLKAPGRRSRRSCCPRWSTPASSGASRSCWSWMTCTW